MEFKGYEPRVIRIDEYKKRLKEANLSKEAVQFVQPLLDIIEARDSLTATLDSLHDALKIALPLAVQFRASSDTAIAQVPIIEKHMFMCRKVLDENRVSFSAMERLEEFSGSLNQIASAIFAILQSASGAATSAEGFKPEEGNIVQIKTYIDAAEIDKFLLDALSIVARDMQTIDTARELLNNSFNAIHTLVDKGLAMPEAPSADDISKTLENEQTISSIRANMQQAQDALFSQNSQLLSMNNLMNRAVYHLDAAAGEYLSFFGRSLS